MEKRFRRVIFCFILPMLSVSGSTSAQTYTEILGRPTGSSITLNLVSDQAREVYWEYGRIPGSYFNSTEHHNVKVNVPLEQDFINLVPDTKYFYRIRYRDAASSGQFVAGPEHHFQTMRASGESFTFTVEADEHLYDKKGVRSLYQICLDNQLRDNPDFMLTLGDIFGDDHHPFDITSGELDSLHKIYRPYLGQICHSVPLYICLGNHEGEKDYYLHQTPPDNMAIYATKWRKYYYPNPYPNTFYTGNSEAEPYGIGNPENYYAWTWGNALFVVLDVYRHDCDTSAKPKNWEWSLGFQEYSWLKNTLENSTSQYKFVFAHHVRGEGRGGITNARLFEWGGYEADTTTWGFTTHRPGWSKPIHQLFVDNGVNIFFQGHDHLFAHETLNGVIYQEVPMPSDSTYKIGILANAGAYVSDTLSGSGHLRVSVSPQCVKVDFVRAFLPGDTLSGTHHNREVAFSYAIGTCPSQGIEPVPAIPSIQVFPNPAKDQVNISLPYVPVTYLVTLRNSLGQIMLQSHSGNIDIRAFQDGLYLLMVQTDRETNITKLVISK